MTTLDLPYPPANNNLYGNRKGGRFKTERYQVWLNAAGWEVKRQRPEPVSGAYSISVEVERKDKRRRDLGNLYKAVSDLLVAHGVVQDDSLEQRIEMAWSQEVKGCRVVITPVQREAA